MLKKILFFLILSCIFSACSNQEIEEITFSSWGSITEVKILNQIISDFHKENPQIRVNFIHIPQNYFQKLHLLFASNTSPDVVFINNLYLPLYTNYLKELPIKKEDFYSKSLEAMSIDGKLYAIPRDISNFVLFYNKNLVEIPPKWDFENFVKSLESSNGEFKISYEEDIFWAEPYILTLGYNDGINFYKNLEGKLAPKASQIGSSTLGQMFLEGRLAFYLSGRWMYPKIKETANFPFGIIYFPGITSANASGWAISKNTKHEKSAIKFVEYLSSQQNIDYLTQTGLIVPARIKSAEKMKDKKAFIDAIKYSKVIKIDKKYQKERDSLNKKLFN